VENKDQIQSFYLDQLSQGGRSNRVPHLVRPGTMGFTILAPTRDSTPPQPYPLTPLSNDQE
jgi:hypothetical protein